MFTPTVIESPRVLEPVDRDPFLDGLEAAPQSTPPAARGACAGGDLAAIVPAAAGGDAAALSCLVARFDAALRSVTRSYRLSSWDADDVVQSTWLQFLEHGHTLREPAAVGGWLMTTARRLSLRVLQGAVRQILTDDPAVWEHADEHDPHHEVVGAERRHALRGALTELPIRSRRLMTVLVAKPDMSYEQVGRVLGMPVGSIGPTRQRSISRLQRSSRLRALHAEP
jgi:RNA polymerase sigma factor (sigma-70 family)